MATEQTIRKATADFHLQSFRSRPRRGERGSVPWGVGNKPDTSKSLHMGNVCRRGTSLLLGRISCESGRLITIVGSRSSEKSACFCIFAIKPKCRLFDVNMTKLLLPSTYHIWTQLSYNIIYYDFIDVHWVQCYNCPVSGGRRPR